MSIIYDGEGKCLDCGYELKQLTISRCPECGKEFDPADETTMNMGKHMGPLAKILFTPVGRPLHIVAALTGLLFLYGASYPGDSSVWLLLAILGAFIAFGYYLLRFAICVLIANIYSQKRIPGGWNWWFVPIIMTVVAVLCMANIPGSTAYYLSKSDMTRIAAKVTAADKGSQFPSQWIGVYPADKIEKTIDGMRFRVHGASARFVLRVWFCYSPEGKPAREGPIVLVDHYDGDWYILYEYAG